MRNYTFKIVYVLVVIFAIFLVVKAVTTDNEAIVEEIVNEVVVLEEAKILPENEGKLVLVSGKMTTAKEGEVTSSVTDKDFGVTVESPKLERIVELYRIKSVNNGKFVYEWTSENTRGKSESVEEITDSKTQEVYQNPRKVLENEIFVSDVYLGEFEIPGEKLEDEPTNATYTELSEYTAEQIDVLEYVYSRDGEYLEKTKLPSIMFIKRDMKEFIIDGEYKSLLHYNEYYTGRNKVFEDFVQKAIFTVEDEYYTTVQDDNEIVGDIRVKFEYIDLDKKGEVTILAQQQGNGFAEYKLDEGTSIFKIFDGNLTKDEVVEKIAAEGSISVAGSIITLLIIIAIGIFIFRNEIKNIIKR